MVQVSKTQRRKIESLYGHRMKTSIVERPLVQIAYHNQLMFVESEGRLVQWIQ